MPFEVHKGLVNIYGYTGPVNGKISPQNKSSPRIIWTLKYVVAPYAERGK